MKVNREKILKSILEESPIYSRLLENERRVLIEDLINTYPYLFERKYERIEAEDVPGEFREQF